MLGFPQALEIPQKGLVLFFDIDIILRSVRSHIAKNDRIFVFYGFMIIVLTRKRENIMKHSALLAALIAALSLAACSKTETPAEAPKADAAVTVPAPVAPAPAVDPAPAAVVDPAAPAAAPATPPADGKCGTGKCGANKK